MSDDETRPIDPDAPVPPPATEKPPAYAAPPQLGGQPAYAMPLPPGYPAYPAQQRPRFADQVMGMRGVVAVALACLIIGGLSGFILGRASGDGQDRLVRGPGFGYFQGGPFQNGPNALPDRPHPGPGQGGR
ncbi:MAG TPA: hypothetical protein VGK78_16370 [Nocardioides sp.]|uniref:hypothetical protein n=1 Tax=Nocardioides sp. TaxID=35761 RepID=UPI002F40CF27